MTATSQTEPDLHAIPTPKTNSAVIFFIALQEGMRSILLGLKVAPFATLLMISINLLSSLLPALQVVIVQYITSAITDPAHPNLFFWLFTASLVLGLGITLTEFSWTSQRVIQQHLQYQYYKYLIDALANLSAQEIASSDKSGQVRQARDTLSSGTVSMQPSGVIGVLKAIVSAISLGVALWYINPITALLVMLVPLPMVFGFGWYAKQDEKYWPLRSQYSKRANYLEDQLTYQKSATELAALATSTRLANIAVKNRRTHSNLNIMVDKLSYYSDGISGIAAVLLVAFALFSLGSSPHLTVAQTTGAVVGVLSALSANAGVGYSIGTITSGYSKVKSYFAFINSVQPQIPTTVVTDCTSLKLSDGSYKYPESSKLALQNIQLEARKGEVIGIVGVNGAGKSTAINAILGLLTLQQGKVFIDGQDASAMTSAKRLAHFGVLTQEFGRYELTVRENLLLGTNRDDVSDEEIWEALRSAQAEQMIKDMPHGLDTQLGQQWKGVGLSGGQWQRLALARLYLRKAGIWVLDEPTSAIDAEAEADIFNQIVCEKADRITVVVSHRAWTLRNLDRIYVFEDGKIVESGNYSELTNRAGRFAKIFQEQISPA